jgi:hypothetical protein
MTVAEGAAPVGGALSERPPISAPGRRAAIPRDRRQPRLGLVGLWLVVPIAAVLAFGAGGAEGSTLILGPIITYGLPLVAMVAFWWEDWPGTRLGASWSGWLDTVLIVVGAVALTGVGQALAGGLDARGLLDPSPGPGHVPTFPATMPLAGAAFVAMLEVTLVGEGWPLRRLPRIRAGLVALAVAWAVALVVDVVLAEVHAPPGSGVTPRHGPVPGADLGAALVAIGAWQVVVYVVWRGWPFAGIASRAVRLPSAHAVVMGGGVATFLVGRHGLGVGTAPLAAAAGCFIAAGLLLGMLLDGWLTPAFAPAAERVLLLAGTLALTAALWFGLQAIADGLRFTRARPDEWVEHVTLNALGVSTIAVGRRWPFAPAPAAPAGRGA